SVAAGTVPLDHPLMLAALWPIAGFALFNLLTAVLDSTFRRPEDQTWLKTFKFYFVRFPLTSALIGGALLYIGAKCELDNVAILLAFIASIAVRNILLSAQLATRDWRRDPKQTWYEQFRKLQTGRLGLVLLKSVGVALCIIAIDKRNE